MIYLLSGVALIFGYLLGSVDGAILLGKVLYGADVREYGSGNAGATNVMRVLGWRVALVTLLVDIAKGALAVALGYIMEAVYPDAPSLLFPAAAGFGAIIGHDWPVYFQFKGGKGVAVTIGVALALVPYAGLIVGICTILVTAVWHYVSLGSLVGFLVLTPAMLLLRPGSVVLLVFSVCATLLGIWAHRDNIRRLLTGTENKFKFSKTGVVDKKKRVKRVKIKDTRI